MQDLHDFETEFTQIRQDLGDLTEKESREHVLSRLPHHLTQWVGEQESRLRTERPQALLTLPVDHTTPEIRATVQAFLGINPKTVERKRFGEFLLQFEDISSLKKMMELDGRTLRGGLPAAKVKEIEQVYTVPNF